MTFLYAVGCLIVVNIACCDVAIAARIFRVRSLKGCWPLITIHLISDWIFIMNLCEVKDNCLEAPRLLKNLHFLMPHWLLITLTIVFLLISANSIYIEYYLRKTTLNPSSINQSFDNINCALSYSAKDGKPILVNRKMVELAKNLTGDRIWNAEDFWQTVIGFTNCEGCEKPGSTDEIAIKMADESIWAFERNEISGEEGVFVEILAKDVTELYTQRQELEKENAKLEKIQNELKVTYRNIAEIQQQEELLTYKMRVHDKLGNAILTSANAFKDDIVTEEEKELALGVWTEAIADLKKNAYRGEVVGDGTLQDVINTANSLGADYTLEGSFPVKNPLLAPALREAMYNAIRHGGANRIIARGTKTENGHYVVISDNGTCKVGKINETGGLATMRRKIERAGGSMKTDIDKGLVLTIFLPNKDINSWRTKE